MFVSLKNEIIFIDQITDIADAFLLLIFNHPMDLLLNSSKKA